MVVGSTTKLKAVSLRRTATLTEVPDFEQISVELRAEYMELIRAGFNFENYFDKRG